MRVGVPREVKNRGVPGGAHPCRGDRAGAGRARGARRARRGRGLLDPGRRLHRPPARGSSPTADDVWADADLLLKVKEPIAEEYDRLRRGQTLFTYLHLAASKECTDALVASGTTAIAYETVQTADGALPLLAPMSEVAGRMAPQVGRAQPGAGARRPRRAARRGLRRVRREGRRHRRRGVRHERRRDRARHAGGGARARPRHRASCAPPTGSTRGTCRPSPPTPTRSSGRCSTPTWSSARCWCPAPRRPTLVSNELVAG